MNKFFSLRRKESFRSTSPSGPASPAQTEATLSDTSSTDGSSCLISPQQHIVIVPKNLSTSKSALSSTVHSSNTSSLKKKWRQYTDPSTGKKYYSDGTSTTWTLPPDS